MADDTFHAYFPGESAPRAVQVRDGRVVRIVRSKARVPKHRFIAPPLFDIQVNGANGVDLQSADLTIEDIAALDKHLAKHGVGMWAPTLITGPIATMKRNCRIIAEAMQDPWLRRRIPGVHLEGPFISPVDGARGAHPKRHVRKPSLREFDALLEAADGNVVYTTIAPDTPGAIPFIRKVVQRGVTVSLGHHYADAETIARAIDAGAALCTHLGNGLPAQIHRHHNPIWPQLTDDRIAASLIADMHHLTGPMIKAFVRGKGIGNTVLVSDCMPIAGLKPGVYGLMGTPVELTKNQRINLVGTDLLAGSALMLIEGVVNTARAAGVPLEDAIDSATKVPARVLGMRKRFDLPKLNRKAHFIIFDAPEDKKPKMRTVFLDGRKVR